MEEERMYQKKENDLNNNKGKKILREFDGKSSNRFSTKEYNIIEYTDHSYGGDIITNGGWFDFDSNTLEGIKNELASEFVLEKDIKKLDNEENWNYYNIQINKKDIEIIDKELIANGQIEIYLIKNKGTTDKPFVITRGFPDKVCNGYLFNKLENATKKFNFYTGKKENDKNKKPKRSRYSVSAEVSMNKIGRASCRERVSSPV